MTLHDSPRGRFLVVGNGWLGRAIAASMNAELVAQRDFTDSSVGEARTIVVASGVSSLEHDEFQVAVQRELSDVARTLDSAGTRQCRVVVLGSSDVCGLASDVTGATPANPVTAYGELKALREDLVVRAIADGANAAVARLAPVHGPGKAQTRRMLAVSRRAVVPLVGGGRHSVGFVTLSDAIGAIAALASDGTTGIRAIGAGRTEMRMLFRSLAAASGTKMHVLPVPVPRRVLAACSRSSNQKVAWFGRLGLDRTVHMETLHLPMTTAEAGRYLVATSDGGDQP
jgi:nucleoside-diphosphate-sugar epimerase